MGHEVSEPPEPVRSAILQLWQTSSCTEEGAFNSGAFRLLEVICGSTYAEIEASRLPQKPSTDSTRKELREALQNFFRWNGAPWYGSPSPDADGTALQLHQAFLTTEVIRTYLAPLDRLYLEDTTQRPHQTLEQLRFGPNEILLLESADLAQRIYYEALRRFDRWYWFPIERLRGFYWLVVSMREKAGPIWKRTRLGWLHTPIGEVDRVPIFEPTYPGPVEDALFVLLLGLVKHPSDAFWEPFAVPWIYSLTSDPFARPPRTPNPSVLTWTLVGYPDQEFEVPDRSEAFARTRNQLEEALEQGWRRLRAAMARADNGQGNFHPLTKHFFVKALAEEGIDQILVNISCIEATLQLPEERTRKNLMARYRRLVDDEEACKWLDHAYGLRNKYLHSLGDSGEAMSWGDLARTRWSVTKAVNRYLALTEARSELSREKLLRSLND